VRAIRQTVFLIFTLLGAGIVHADDPPLAQRHFQSVTAENFDDGGAVSRRFHLNAGAYLRNATIAHGAAVRPLASEPSAALSATEVQSRLGTAAFADYVASDPLLDGVLILHRGAIAFEAYPNMQPWQRHFAWSVTKVLTAATLAALVDRGEVDMQVPVDAYVPALKASAWAGIPLQHIADMASGIDCLDSDGYQDTSTCVYAMEEALGITASTGRELGFMDQLQAMQMHRESGRYNEYVSANTNVLMLVIEAVSGRPFAEAVREAIWSRIGTEADALMAISAEGYAYASGGLSARLRDVARFGQVFVDAGDSGALSAQIVRAMQTGGLPLDDESLEWLNERFDGDLPARAAWQWDLIWPDGAMYKGGYSGQGLYVDPARDLVIAWFGTDSAGNEDSNEILPIARQLVRAGLFEKGSP
jgi:CubicO group peptidase (beta-lactamase class C family)